MVSFREMGKLIGKYLREKDNEEIGRIIFHLDSQGELFPFIHLYEEAKEYYAK